MTDDVHVPTPEELRAAGIRLVDTRPNVTIISPSQHAALSDPLGSVRLTIDGFVAARAPVRMNRRARRARAAQERRR